MKVKVYLLRIAAALVLVHLLGHAGGHFSWDKPKDPRMQEVVNNMFSYKAQFMGANRSMADYFQGYSLMLFFVLGMSIFILWYVSGFINTQRAIAIKILYPIGIAFLAFGVIEYLYFFLFAACISLLAGALTIVAAAIKN